MERFTKKNSKTAQILENQKSSNSNKLSSNSSASSSTIETSDNTTSSITEYSSPFSFFYSMIPKEILGIPVAEIKKDISDMSQLTSM